jgi:hypothetical protein
MPSIKVNREKLLHCLESVQWGTTAKEVIDQSDCFVFIHGHVVTYSGDDTACRMPLPEEAASLEGAVKARELLALLSKLSEDFVGLDTADGELQVTGKRRKSGIKFQAEVSMPVARLENPGEWKEVGEAFSEAVKTVHHCAGTDDSNFVLTCVHITNEFMEACNSFQACRYVVPLPVTAPVLIKHSSVSPLGQLGVTHLCEGAAWMHFKNKHGLVYSCRRFLSDEFPHGTITKLLDFEGVPVSLPAGLGDAADMASIFTGDSSDPNENQVMIELKPGKVRLYGDGANGWHSETKESTYAGKPMSFCIPTRLLTELVGRHQDVLVSDNRMRIDCGAYKYLTRLLSPREKGK